MNKPFPALCLDCKWSIMESKYSWNNLCMHPEVVSRDSWALANNREGMPRYSSCERERAKQGWFAPCGMKGKLWEK